MILFSTEEFAKLKEKLTIYRCALKNMEARVDIMLEDFMHLQPYNPIEHVKSRLKSPERIAEKLQRRGFPITTEAAQRELTDIAGIRCICSYAKDIYQVADVFRRQQDIKILKERDYITTPKDTGYRSYHLIIEVPVYLTATTEYLPVEVQVRTQAMDFWASLEHKVRYRYSNQIPENLSRDLVRCAEQIAELDNTMYLIQEIADETRGV